MEDKLYTKGKCYSRGNINAAIMVIGQSPTLEEVMHSVEKENGDSVLMPIPLCGQAGRLLHSMLSYTGLIEGDFILTNSVKFATLKNKNYVRPPSEKELLDSRHDVLTEIVKVNPKLIITLGKEPLWSLLFSDKTELEEFQISKYNGELQTLELNPLDYLDYPIQKQDIKVTYKILPLFHPAAILRDTDGSRGYKKLVTEALLKNRELFESLVNRIIK